MSLIGHNLATQAEISQAFREWRVTGHVRSLASLPGNSSGFVSAEDGTALAFGDCSTMFPLYYTQGPSGIAIGVDAAHLAKEAQSGLDTVTLAAWAALGIDHLGAAAGYSFFEDVRQLRAGEALHVTPKGVSFETYETFAPNPDGTWHAAAEMTREALREGLQRRLDSGEVITHFSGGVDSSSMGFTAAALSRSGKPLPAFIHHNRNYPAGDLPYARRLARQHASIDLRELEDTAAEFPYSVLDPAVLPYVAAEPYRTVHIFGRQRRLVQAGKLAGGTIHLTGTGGDALYDSQPYIADLVQTGQIARAKRESMLLARLYQDVPQSYFEMAKYLSKLTMAQAYERLADVLDHPQKRAGFNVGWVPRPTQDIECLTPEMREKLRERIGQIAGRLTTDLTLGDYNTIAQIRDSGDAQRHLMHLSAGAAHAPFLDYRVIRAALELPAYERTQPGQLKPLLEAALGGRFVPGGVFNRPGKGSYGKIDSVGRNLAQHDLLALFNNSHLAELGIIDQETIRGAITSNRARYSLRNIVAAEIWLRQRKAEKTISSGTSQVSEAAVTRRKLSAPQEAIRLVAGYFRRARDADLPRTGPACNQSHKQLTPEAIHELTIRTAQVTPELEFLLSNTVPAGESVAFEVLRIRNLRPEEQCEPTREEAALGRAALDQLPALTSERAPNTIRSYLEQLHQTTQRPAAAHEVRRNLAIVHQLAFEERYMDQRVACLERALATAIMTAQQGKSVTLVYGCRRAWDNAWEGSFHAWLEAEGQPVTTGADDPITPQYEAIFRIGKA